MTTEAQRITDREHTRDERDLRESLKAQAAKLARGEKA